MKSRAQVDPELHGLRSVAQSLDHKSKQNVESARFNLYSAFEQRDAALARRWARALRVALLAAREQQQELADQGLAMLGELEQAIEAAS